MLQASAFLAVWLSTYYPGLDILLAFVYIVVLSAEACRLKGYNRLRIFLIALFWQGPAALLSLLAMGVFYIYALSDNAIFLLEFWTTPLLPLLTLNEFNYWQKPLYYYILLAAPGLLGIYYYVMNRLQNKMFSLIAFLKKRRV